MIAALVAGLASGAACHRSHAVRAEYGGEVIRGEGRVQRVSPAPPPPPSPTVEVPPNAPTTERHSALPAPSRDRPRAAAAPPPSGLRAEPAPQEEVPPLVTGGAAPPRTSAHPPSESAAAPTAPGSPSTAVNVNFSEVDQILQGLPLGNITYNAPDTMLLGDRHDIYLLLSPSQSAEQLQSQLQSRLGHPETLQSVQIKIAERMQATLTGEGFEITPSEPQEQAVSGTEPTEWHWTVSSKEAGQQELQLDLYVLVVLKDSPPMPRKIRTFTKTIRVRVTLGRRLAGFVGDNWQWLWGTLLVPLAGWLWARRRKAKSAA